jgi:hypothetical protein
MPALDIKIWRKSEKDVAWPDIDEKNYVEELTLERAVILEKGMGSGATSVMFLARDQAGGYYPIQTSAAIIDGLHGAIRGAEARWRDNPE